MMRSLSRSVSCARDELPPRRGPALRRCLKALCLIAILIIPGACVQIGPKVLKSGRSLYNEAVQETESQQLLLNIVRQRYSDPVLFLDVTSISSGYAWEASADLLGTFSSGPNSGVAGLGGTVSETPLITYAPNNGEKFVRQMLTPMDLDTLVLIIQAGWSVERVLLIIGQSINQLRNTLSGNDGEAGFVKYQEVLSALREMQRAGQMGVGAEQGTEGEERRLTLYFNPEVTDSTAYHVVCESIKVACDGRPLRLHQAIGIASDEQTMALATRSLFSAMYFLAQGVEVPDLDATSGFATGARKATSGLFGPGGTDETLFHVYSSHDEPENAAIKVFYRDSWFYIADNDRESKVTFSLVSLLVMLQSGDTERITPLITMPVR